MQINYFFKNFFRTMRQSPLNGRIRFQFCFISLISPLSNRNSSMLTKSSNKLTLKHSYLLLTWMYHLSFAEKLPFNKQILNFFIAPSKRYIFTNVKAPIAHKTWSKEQYQKKYFKLKVSLRSVFLENTAPSSVNAAAWVILFTKKNFPNFSTNLLFLQSALLTYEYHENLFFNLHKFN